MVVLRVIHQVATDLIVFIAELRVQQQPRVFDSTGGQHENLRSERNCAAAPGAKHSLGHPTRFFFQAQQGGVCEERHRITVIGVQPLAPVILGLCGG